MEGVDRRLLTAVAEALIRGQSSCSQEEVADAYQQIQAARTKGAAAEMVLQGRLDVALKDGEIHFLNPVTATQVGDADRPSDPYAAAEENGGIIALDVWPGQGGPVMLVAEQLADPPNDGDDDGPQECFAFTLIDLNHGLDLFSFSVPLSDLMRVVAQAPLRPLEGDGGPPEPPPPG